MSSFELPLSRHIWEEKYRDANETDIHQSWRRVARTLAEPETSNKEDWHDAYLHILTDFRFIPGGRVLAGAGTKKDVTLFNCFVMGSIEDSLDGIFDALKEGALTMQRGGGVGYDFSTLRPTGARSPTHGTVASGPVSFMGIWDSMCATMISTGNRRGAMMGTLRCDHPDIEAFIEAKRDPNALRNFNVSVLITDAFMKAVRADGPWPLSFPGDGSSQSTLYPTVNARELWNKLIRASYDCAEPGVLFIDRINDENNLSYRESISATNPCGEIPLPAYGACNLGSVNLALCVADPFTEKARLEMADIEALVKTAVRMLDNVIDASRYPLDSQADQAKGTRRIGLGITGLADALIQLGLGYDSDAGRETAADIMRHIRNAAYNTSVELARDKAPFPFFNRDAYLASPFIQRLPTDLRDRISRYGIRNSHLLAIAPTGTISLLANNVSNGVEPVYGFEYERKVRQLDGGFTSHSVTDFAWRHFRRLHPESPLPPAFVDALSLSPRAHLLMQAALQPFVDQAISKTINIPTEFPFEDYVGLYESAYDLGLKGCTTFRPNPVTGSILSTNEGMEPESHCCSLDRENA